MDQYHRSAASGVCPACGTPYPTARGDGLGCPVCLLQEALHLASEADQDHPSDEGRFDHYELVQCEDGAFEELGRGAMGITYKALDTILGHAVALKVLDARMAAHPQARERFLREARTAARLRHPNVASVFYYRMRKSDGQCFYAMELVEGESLAGRVRRLGPLPVDMALELVTQVARALTAAQAQGLVHWDLKPAHLMLVNGRELTVKVIDFGLTKAVAAADETDLTQGGVVGAPAFASPEQFCGGDVDARSDLYALGVTLWHALTGQAPFQGSRAEVMRQHLQAPLPLERLQGLPQPVTALLQTLLEQDPTRRFQSPAQLLQVIPSIAAAIAAPRALPPPALREASANRFGPTRRRARSEPEKISVARLPVTGGHLFGREEDLAFLDRAWADPQVNVVSIVAWAGVGKSTLVNHWLRRLAADRYRGAAFVFGWSFYRQGTTGEASSADEFLDAALAWFGDPDPRRGTAWEKGERLAQLIAPRRTLLVLDGLEPLQRPPGTQEGRLREPALQALLRELAAFNRGLCVITTRLPVAELADHEGSSTPRRELERLSREAGAQLLRALGVKGSEAELQTTSNDFDGHCLALTLLGSYLSDAFRGDIRCRTDVLARLADDVRQGSHARKVMASYQSWFGEGPEVSALRLLGLFDRPADERALRVLLKPPAIPALTDSLTGFSPAEWRAILTRLRRARLLAGEDPHHPGQVDVHPLVREYFGEQLRSMRAAAWQEANRRLYDHYRTLAPPLPETFREMEPLFLAVSCGCQAGFHREALHEVYIPRIQRGEAYFAANVLGARGPLLSTLSHFFERGRWGSSVETGPEGQRLTAEDQLFILMQAALYLTATRGYSASEARLCYERAEPLCRSLNRPLLLYSALMGQWRYSLMTDALTATMQIAERVYALAQAQGEPALRIGAYRVLAMTSYYLGDFEAARRQARRGVWLWRSGRVPSSVEEAVAPAVSCLCYKAFSEWHFAEIASCRVTMAEALALARELKDMHGLAAALWHAMVLGYYEGNPAEVERLATELIELGTRQHFAQWLTGGKLGRGWARSAAGDTAGGISLIEDAVRDYRASGSVLYLPGGLGLRAEVLHLAGRTPEALETIREAEAVGERRRERWWSADLQRLRGVFLAALGADEAQIEAAFRQAIDTARQQKSVSLLKRAEASRADHHRRKGR